MKYMEMIDNMMLPGACTLEILQSCTKPLKWIRDGTLNSHSLYILPLPNKAPSSTEPHHAILVAAIVNYN